MDQQARSSRERKGEAVTLTPTCFLADYPHLHELLHLDVLYQGLPQGALPGDATEGDPGDVTNQSLHNNSFPRTENVSAGKAI